MEYGVDLQKALALRKEGKHKEAYAYLKQACKNKDGYACYFMYQAYKSGGWTKCLNKRKAKKYLELAKAYGCQWVNASEVPNNYRMGLILEKQGSLFACSYFMNACDDDGLIFAAYDVWRIQPITNYLKKAAEYGDCRAKYELFKNEKILKDIADQGHSASCVDYANYRFRKDNFEMKYTVMSRDWKFIRKRLRFLTHPLEYEELCYYGQICSAYRKKHGIAPNPLKLDPYWKALLVYEAKFRAKKTAMMTLFLCVPLYKDIRKVIWNCADAWPIPDLGLSQRDLFYVLPVRVGWSRLFIKSDHYVNDFYQIFEKPYRFVHAKTPKIVIWEGRTKDKEEVITNLRKNLKVEFVTENLPMTEYCL